MHHQTVTGFMIVGIGLSVFGVERQQTAPQSIRLLTRTIHRCKQLPDNLITQLTSSYMNYFIMMTEFNKCNHYMRVNTLTWRLYTHARYVEVRQRCGTTFYSNTRPWELDNDAGRHWFHDVAVISVYFRGRITTSGWRTNDWFLTVLHYPPATRMKSGTQRQYPTVGQ